MSKETTINVPSEEFGAAIGSNGDSEARSHEERARCPLTQYGNAERLARQHGDSVRYLQKWNRWLEWDGTRWVADETGAIVRRAKATARSISREAAQAHSETDRDAIRSWAKASESKGHIMAMIEMARSEKGIPLSPDELDRDPWAFNCLNGTLDLRSGELRPHQREDLISKLAPVRYDSHATCPTWDAFLDRIMAGNQNLVEYLQRVLGYCLTGKVGEQALFFGYGTGANGKSTLLRVFLDLMGDYGKQGAPELLIAKGQGDHPTAIADLRGARLVSLIEVEEGKRFAEVLVKWLTGDDRIKARFMFQDFFEFEPTHKIFLAANHKPTIRGTDHAIWRRICLIPFAVTIPEQEQDKQLTEKLRAEFPGILRWAVQGCLAWQGRLEGAGLNPPEEVRAAREEYRHDMDVIQQFIDECCVLRPNSRTGSGKLHEAYRKWAERNGDKDILSNKAFTARLTGRGLEMKRRNTGTVWQGITLRAEGQGGEPDTRIQ
jgi:putative DNA primase/helicase